MNDVFGALCMRADRGVPPRAKLIPRLRRALAVEDKAFWQTAPTIGQPVMPDGLVRPAESRRKRASET